MMATATTAVQQLLGSTFDKCESPSLRLEKFVILEEKSRKKDEISRVVACANRAPAGPSPSWFSTLPGAQVLAMKLQSRLIINQAGGILENAGLCLHPHFNCPMIPGSAVKGIARHAAIQAIRDANSAEEKAELLVKTALIFGWCEQEWSVKTTKTGTFASDFRYACNGAEQVWTTVVDRLLGILNVQEKRSDRRNPLAESLPNFAGMVGFLPAFPAKGSAARLAVDIVNCHHPKYYQGDRAYATATDTESPIPVFFPAVEAGVFFDFAVVPVRRSLHGLPPELAPAKLAECARNWLRTGLEAHGAGAKTNAGYGWFEYDAAEVARQEKQRSEEQASQAQREVERVRRTALSPDEQAAEDFVKILGNDPVGTLKGKMAQIATLPETEQRAICVLLRNTYAKEWAVDVAEASKAKGPDDKKGGKSLKRVTAVRSSAAKLGVELP